MAYTLTFSDRSSDNNSGWTSFWSYYPEQILGLGNRFYTIKDGQLWEHNDNYNSKRNNIYGQVLNSKITTIFNQEAGEDKIFKNVILEGNRAWSVNIKTNYTQGNIRTSEFVSKESKWMAYTRKNELISDLTDRVQGIGNLASYNGLTLHFNSNIPMLVNIGELLYELVGSSRLLIGTITGLTVDSITVNTYSNTPVVGGFVYTLKHARVQGSELRGYYAELVISTNTTAKIELFAVSSNVVKSYVGTKF